MITFTADERSNLVNLLQTYFQEELDTELKQFPAEFLLDYLSEHLGAHYYNRGLLDAQAILEKRMESLTEAIDELTMPVNIPRR